MIIPSARNQTPTTTNEARAKRNNLGEASVDDPEGIEEGTDRDTSDLSRLSNGHFAHANSDARKVAAFNHSEACDD